MSIASIAEGSLSGLEIVLGKYALYIIAGFAALSVIFGCGWYVSNLKLDNEKLIVKNTTTQLDVSNGSVASLKQQFVALNKTLSDNAALEQKQIDGISTQLQAVDKSDQGKVALETVLKNRPSQSNCTVPKDLLDAWNQL